LAAFAIAWTVLAVGTFLPSKAYACCTNMTIRGNLNVVQWLGDWHVTRHTTFLGAEAVFGFPNQITNWTGRRGSPCERTVWRDLGLYVRYLSHGSYESGEYNKPGPYCDGTKFAESAAIRGRNGRRSFKTSLGLRVGDSISRLRRLYPGANSRMKRTVWYLDNKPRLGCGSRAITANARRGCSFDMVG